MPALPYLREQTIGGLQTLSQSLFATANGCLAFNANKFYVLSGNTGQTTARRIYVLDSNLNLLASEGFAMPDLASPRTWLGIDVSGTRLYAVASNTAAKHFADMYIINLTDGTIISTFALMSSLSYEYFCLNIGVTFDGEGVIAFGITHQRRSKLMRVNTADGSIIPQLITFSTTDYSRGRGSLAKAGNNQYLLNETTDVIHGYDSNWTIVNDNDFMLEEDNANPVGMAWDGGALVVLDEDTGTLSDRTWKMYYYGIDNRPEPPASIIKTLQITRTQQPFEKFDAVSVNADNVVTEKVNDFKALRRTVRSVPDVASSVTVQKQSSFVTIVPEYTQPEIVIGDFIYINEGSTRTLAPEAGRMTVKGITTVNNNLKQIITAEKS